MRPLIWFRSDLRVADNRALYRACKDADDGVVGVFTACFDQWQEHDWGAPKADFVLRNLKALSANLADERNIPLKILVVPGFDGAPKALLKLARSTKCDALYFNDEYEVNERKRDDAVEELFEKNDLSVHRFTDQVILEPGSVKTQQDGWYSVFTPFKRRWIETCADRDDLDPLYRPRAVDPIDLDPDPVPPLPKNAFPGTESVREDLWPAGEEFAMSRLKAFAEQRIDRYDERRDIPSVNGTSTLSPYLAAGVISPRQCLKEALEANNGRLGGGKKSKPNDAEVWISELIWREFYKHLLIGFPRLSRSRAFKRETEKLKWRDSDSDFEAWCVGETGFPIVDAAMRQLNQTGWMHNRLRMIAAMFLTKDLFLDWRRGERYFMQRLVDGDLAANNGGWQWSASTGTDAAPYFRIFNPTTQGERYDPDGEFIKKFLPQLEPLSGKDLHDPSRLDPEARDKLDYPEPICDHSEARDRAISAFKALK